MKTGLPTAPSNGADEISTLIETLNKIEQRLLELTAGEIDSVSDSKGRSFLLRRAQEEMRQSEESRQAAILDALPAHIALIDTEGVIVAVNQSWRRFAVAAVSHCPGYEIGLNYLDICDRAKGDGAAEAHLVAEGIRSVLRGGAKSYSIECECTSADAQRWFLLTVTRLADDHPNGAVVMHQDITERKRSADVLRMASGGATQKLKHQVRIELVMVLAGTVATFALSLQFNWFEAITKWILTHEVQQINDVVVAAVFLLMGLSVFAYRRWRESQLELISRWRVQASMELLHDELEQRVKQRTAELGSANQTLCTEMSGRKHIENALRESDEKFHQLADNIADVFWITSPDFKTIHYISPGYERVWARSTGSLYSHPHQWIEAIHPEDRDGVWSIFTKLRNEATMSVEYRIVRPDGAFRWVHDRGFQVRDAAGKVIRLAGIASDITERKQIEESLRDSEARKNAIVQSSLDCIVAMDHEGKILEFNPAAEKVFGYSRAEVMGRDLAEVLIPPSLRVQHRQGMLRYLASGEAKILDKRIELVAMRAGGAEFPVELAITRMGAGVPPTFTGFIRDITERKRVEVSLQRRQTELRVLFDLMPAMIWFKDTQNRILRLNQRAAATTGKTVEQLEGKSTFDIYPEEAAKFFADDMEVIRAGMPKLGIVETLRDKNHREVWVQTDKVPVLDDNGVVIGLVVMAQDITARKMAEVALRESEERFSGAFEYAPIGVALVSLVGGFLKVNRVLCELVGYSEAAMLTRTFQEITYPDDLDADLNYMGQLLAGKIPSYQMEKRYIRADGRVVNVLLNGSLVRDGNGEPRYFIAQVQDITARRLAEEALRASEIQLRQSQKLDAIGQLAGGVAHDFNNLLTVILGRAELLNLRTDLAEPVRRSINLIHQTGTRAAVLTRQLLQFSRQQLVQTQVLDVNVLVSGMQEMLRRLISEDISLVLKFKSKSVSVKADPGQIEQVVMNLVINARDAMPRGGTVTIETSNVELDAAYCKTHEGASPGPHVMLAVGDTGCGMDEAVRARIFEPFFTTKEKGKGTGLGLSTVYGIVKQSGGSIYVYSGVNQGASFKVYLPEVKERALAETPAEVVSVKGGGETILLAEDEDGIRELLNEILTENGYTVIQANDGADAVKCSDEFSGIIHLLLTDVVMPKMNGKDVARKVLQKRPDLKVIFMSGYTSDAIVSRGVVEDDIEFLEKPFTPTSVATKIRDVLDRSVNSTPKSHDGK